MMYDRFPRLHLLCRRSLTSLGAPRQYLASLADFQPDIEHHHSGALPAVQPNRDMFIIVRLNILSDHLPRTQRTVSSKMLSRWDGPMHTTTKSLRRQIRKLVITHISNDIHDALCQLHCFPERRDRKTPSKREMSAATRFMKVSSEARDNSILISDVIAAPVLSFKSMLVSRVKLV